jgi:hypothetical protein
MVTQELVTHFLVSWETSVKGGLAGLDLAMENKVG